MGLARMAEIAKRGADAFSHASIADIPATGHITLISSVRSLRVLAEKWRELERNSLNPISVFQSFDWVLAWCETYEELAPEIELHIIAGYDEDRLVFLWPLMKYKRSGFRVLSWLTEPFGQYGDVLCARGHCPRQWMESSLKFLRRMNGVDIMRLRHVRMDSHLASFGSGLFSDAKSAERAPFLDLTKFNSEDEYEQRYTSTQRKRRKKIRKHLEDQGDKLQNYLSH